MPRSKYSLSSIIKTDIPASSAVKPESPTHRPSGRNPQGGGSYETPRVASVDEAPDAICVLDANAPKRTGATMGWQQAPDPGQ